MNIKFTGIVLIALIIVNETIPPDNDWKQREITVNIADTLLTKGSTYLPVYSEIYQRNKNFTFDLTATISIRNISISDTIFLFKADYYNTHGDLIHKYIEKPVFVRPMETIEIVVNEGDKIGGTGANFVFDWAKRINRLDPFFEAVMISTSGQQGLSFTTQGIRKK
jgi:hypothetical protein